MPLCSWCLSGSLYQLAATIISLRLYFISVLDEANKTFLKQMSLKKMPRRMLYSLKSWWIFPQIFVAQIRSWHVSGRFKEVIRKILGVTQTCFSKIFQYGLKEFWINLSDVLFNEIVFHASLFCMKVLIPEQKECVLKCLFLCFIV